MISALQKMSGLMLPSVTEEMQDVLRWNQSEAQDELFAMMHYHMGWRDEALEPVASSGGKQVRPLLCLLSCSAADGDWQQAVPAAAAVELLHNFTLLHDDIEDHSPTRRGRPTAWKLWGVAQAINCGDSMFALAHIALTDLQTRGVSAETTLRALERFDATCVHLTQGQYADMAFETRSLVSVDAYLAMIEGKTAALLGLCCELGALVAGASETVVADYREFGRLLGLAFQVIDDILGIWGDESAIGKSAATDIVTRKKTLPVLYGLEQSTVLRELYATASPPDDFVDQAVAALDACGARQYAEEKATQYTAEAQAHLTSAQPSEPAAGALTELTRMLLRRDF